MIIAVGSANAAKIQGTSHVFAKLMPGSDVRQVDTSSVTRTQPMGLDQILHGAIDRARFALSAAKADLGVGVEAGIFAVAPDVGHLNLPLAAIVDKDGRISIGSSAGFPLPPLIVEKMRGGEGARPLLLRAYGCARPRGRWHRLPPQQGLHVEGRHDRAVRDHGPRALAQPRALRSLISPGWPSGGSTTSILSRARTPSPRLPSSSPARRPSPSPGGPA